MGIFIRFKKLYPSRSGFKQMYFPLDLMNPNLQALARSLTLTHSLSLSLSHAQSLSLTHPLTHAPTHSLTHSLTHSFTHIQHFVFNAVKFIYTGAMCISAKYTEKCNAIFIKRSIIEWHTKLIGVCASIFEISFCQFYYINYRNNLRYR